jgi:uncharacterized DUF497 family protein
LASQLRIDNLDAAPAVVAKLWAKHRVDLDEAIDVVFSAPTHIRRDRDDLYLLYGRTEAGRYLLVVIALSARNARLVTARDLTITERKFYAKQKES